MIINFRHVNIAICHHLQLSLNARSCICEGIRSTVGHSVATLDYLYKIIKVFRTCSTRLLFCRPIQTSVVEHFFSSLLLMSYIFVFFSFFRWTVSNRGTQVIRHRVLHLIWVLTVWPSKTIECYINMICYSVIGTLYITRTTIFTCIK